MSEHLEARVAEFVGEMTRTLGGVLPGEDPPSLVVLEGDRGAFVIRPSDQSGIPLTADGVIVMRLEIDLHLILDSSRKWLKVLRSAYSVVPEGKGTPFFRYDYNTEARTVPQAHINVHAHRDELTKALLGTGKSSTAKRRRKKFLDEGTLPQVSSFHFPVGGFRFRPCLEDVLEIAIDEFALDKKDGYRDVLKEGRMQFRTNQLKAVVRDSPDAVIGALEELGYRVSSPQEVRASRPDWLNAL